MGVPKFSALARLVSSVYENSRVPLGVLGIFTIIWHRPQATLRS